MAFRQAGEMSETAGCWLCTGTEYARRQGIHSTELRGDEWLRETIAGVIVCTVSAESVQ